MTDNRLKSIAERPDMKPVIRRLLDGMRRTAELDREIRALFRLARRELGITTAELEYEIIKVREAEGRLAKNKVYFARLMSRDAVKIGVTADVEHRIKQLPYTLNSAVELIGAIDGDGVAERVVHHQLRAHCLSGEIFHWSPIEPTVRDLIARNSALVRP